MELVPTVIVAVVVRFFLWNRTASVLLWLKETLFPAAYSSAAAAAAESLAATSSSFAPAAHHPMDFAQVWR